MPGCVSTFGRRVFLALAMLSAGGVALILPDPAAAQGRPFMRATEPCPKNANGNCFTFVGPVSNRVANLRSIEITMPRPGALMISVTGVWACNTNSTTQDSMFGSIGGQIVALGQVQPDPTGPGGIVGSIRLSRHQVTPNMGDFGSFTLTASRLFQVRRAMKKRYFFRASMLVYEEMSCRINSLDMQATFIPR